MEIHLALARALSKEGFEQESLAAFQRALQIQPVNGSAYFDIGKSFFLIGDFQGALSYYERAVVCDPSYAAAIINRGNSLVRMGRVEEALSSYLTVQYINPESVSAFNNAGNLLHSYNDFEAAKKSFSKALVLNPASVQTWVNLGNTLMAIKSLSQSAMCYEIALSLDRGDVEAAWNKSLLMLLLGDMPAGWSYYEKRLEKKDLANNFHHFPDKPHWRGERDIRGQRLLVYSEQGAGDCIQFVRYVPMLESLGAEIVLQVPGNLQSLIATLRGTRTTICKGDPLPDFDTYCALMSLPMIFSTGLRSIPAAVPYLEADRSKVDSWHSRLGGGSVMRVGVVWSGTKSHSNDHNRSIPAWEFEDLFDLPVEWHSLQIDYREKDRAVLERCSQVRDHSGQLSDFSDTAALVECMDLVISVDTSVAHVAGALGKPVWVLLPFVPDFRWLLDRPDSPWYPSARLFRQARFGDWRGVLTAVRQTLELSLTLK